MTKTAKARIIIFIIILLVLSYFSVGYTYEVFNVSVENYFIDADNINNINIDGADFTPMFRIMGYGMNTFLGFLMYGLFAVIIGIVSIIFIIPFRFIGLRKQTKITILEKKITLWSFGGIVLLSVCLALILTKGTVIIPLLFYTAIWALPMFFIYVLAILKRNV